MSRNGSGIYVLPAGQPVVTGTTISSTTHNTLMSDLANALTTSIASDGQTAMSANLPMGSNKLTGLAAATVAGDAARYEQIGQLAIIQGAAASGANNDITKISGLTTPLSVAQGGTGGNIQLQDGTAFTTAGTSTAYTLTPIPALASLTSGKPRYNVQFNVASGLTPTISVSGLAAVSLKVYNSSGVKTAPAAASIFSGMLSDIEYDGTDFIILNPLPVVSLGVNLVVIVSSGNWTVPVGVTKCKVTVIGGGGGGATAGSYPAGGGAGGVAIKGITGLVPGAVISVTVGVQASTSSFGAYCSATGGDNGVSTALAGTQGGLGSGGDINSRGGAGGGLTTFSGVGSIPGFGGNSIYGGGGLGAGVGAGGGAFGAGGGGGLSGAGGSGASGAVIVEY